VELKSARLVEMGLAPPTNAEWKDASLMGFMIESLAKDRSVDPEAWDQKVEFWKRTVVASVSVTLTFTLNDLIKALQWEGNPNRGLEDVLPMMLGKELLNADDIVSGRGFVASVTQGAVAYVASWVWTPSLPKARFVSKASLELQSSQLLRTLTADCHGTLDFIQSLHSIEKKCPQLSVFDLRLLLRYLCQQKHAVFCTPIDSPIPIVKFASARGQNVTASPTDAAIGQLNHTIGVLEAQVGQASLRVDAKNKEIQQLLAQKNRSRALLVLRERKRLDQVCERLHSYLENAYKLHSSIDSLHTSKQVAESLSLASDTLARMQREWNLDTDSIDELMSRVAEGVSEGEATSKRLSQPIIQGDDLKDFESELEQLTRDMEAIPSAASAVTAVTAATATSSSSSVTPAASCTISSATPVLSSATPVISSATPAISFAAPVIPSTTSVTLEKPKEAKEQQRPTVVLET